MLTKTSVPSSQWQFWGDEVMTTATWNNTVNNRILTITVTKSDGGMIGAPWTEGLIAGIDFCKIPNIKIYWERWFRWYRITADELTVGVEVADAGFCKAYRKDVSTPIKPNSPTTQSVVRAVLLWPKSTMTLNFYNDTYLLRWHLTKKISVIVAPKRYACSGLVTPT